MAPKACCACNRPVEADREPYSSPLCHACLPPKDNDEALVVRGRDGRIVSMTVAFCWESAVESLQEAGSGATLTREFLRLAGPEFYEGAEDEGAEDDE